MPLTQAERRLILTADLESTTRQALAEAAWGWLGTPYHHHARLRGAGVDCINLVAAVYHSCGLVDDLDLGNYPAQWHLHRGEELMLQGLARCGAHEVQTPALGDVGVWQFGRAYSHGGVVARVDAGGPTIVHAYIGRGVMASRPSEEPLAGRPVRWFSVFDTPSAKEG